MPLHPAFLLSGSHVCTLVAATPGMKSGMNALERAIKLTD